MALKKIVITLFVLLGYVNLFAQEEQVTKEERSTEELAKLAQNPLANMMSFPFQNNSTFGVGEFGRTSNVLNIQPVLPFLNGHLITRTIIPLVSQPVGETETISGVGDITFTAFYAPTPKKGLIWGIGPVLVIPTTADVSSEKWSAGPSVVLIKMSKKIVYGFVINNVWSFAGTEGKPDVNSLLFNYFFNYNLPKGWYLTSAPTITANKDAVNGNKWVVPFGGGGGKIVRIGKIPFNIQAQVFYNAIKPDSGGEFSTRFQIQMLLPK